MEGLKQFAERVAKDPKMDAALAVVDVARAAGELLRKWRKSAELTQPELATRLGVTQPRISQVESGRAQDTPPVEFMARYAHACGDRLELVSRAWLMNLAQELDDARTQLEEANRKLAAAQAASGIQGDKWFAAAKRQGKHIENIEEMLAVLVKANLPKAHRVPGIGKIRDLRSRTAINKAKSES